MNKFKNWKSVICLLAALTLTTTACGKSTETEEASDSTNNTLGTLTEISGQQGL